MEKNVRRALIDIANAAEQVRRDAHDITKQAAGVVGNLDRGQNVTFGYSNQTLIECAANLARYESLVRSFVALTDDEEDLAALQQVVAQPNTVWDFQ